MANETTIRAALQSMALDTLTLDGEGEDRTLSEAIPVPLAQQLCARLEAHDVPASWAHDGEDRELAWVYC